jgi:hypothetical protein
MAVQGAYKAASGTTNLTVTPGTPNVAWAGSTPSRTSDISRTPGTPTVAWTGSTPTLVLSSDLTLTPGTPNVAWAGSTPTLTGTNDRTLTPGTAEVVWSGSTPTVIQEGEVTVTPGSAEVVWTGSTPTLRATPDVEPEPPGESAGDGGDGFEDFSTEEDRHSLTLRPGTARVVWTGSPASVRVKLDPLRVRLLKPRREVPAPAPVEELSLVPGRAVVAYSGSTAPVRVTSLPSVEELQAELAKRDEQIAALTKRLDALERDREDDFAVMAALNG